tara:strand:+ start:863 stop:1069 length:207 start_codon:yes stop_codon:yes gene_type:complete
MSVNQMKPEAASMQEIEREREIREKTETETEEPRNLTVKKCSKCNGLNCGCMIRRQASATTNKKSGHN